MSEQSRFVVAVVVLVDDDGLVAIYELGTENIGSSGDRNDGSQEHNSCTLY